ALPSSLALGSSFDPELARRAGAMVGAEARSRGFNVLLGGGVNLARDPRNGRNFEYLSEDPLLSGVLAGEEVAGTQSQGVISTLKHFALNDNETNRHHLDARIDPAALRESDLLAFQIAIERGQPGSIMCAYNEVNGAYACSNPYLLQDVLRHSWGYPGWVMSDWGAVHGADDAAHGLDQESGVSLGRKAWFDAPLRAALASGALSHQRLSEMVRRILRSIYAVGADHIDPRPVDLDQDRAVALDVEREGLVLLKNDGVLPLSASTKTVAVIGGLARVGTLSGGGSSQVTPVGGYTAIIPLGQAGVAGSWNAEHFGGAAPYDELVKLLPAAHFSFDPGVYPARAAALARRVDVAIVFVNKFEIEGEDSPDLTLPGSQDALIAAVAAVNPNTIVVLETGNPITMPWKSQARAIVAAWYPGQAGGQAIAEVLTGHVNPSGHLALSFPESLQDLPRPELPGFGTPGNVPLTVEYTEGADVGYRWFAKAHRTAAFPFGFGLSYTYFDYEHLQVHAGGSRLEASFTVRNAGELAGATVAQLYLTEAAGAPTLRLVGFQRIELAPGESRRVALQVDPRLLSAFDPERSNWHQQAGRYQLKLAQHAADAGQTVSVKLGERRFGH
ncbi:MAG: glycoside hydrolase family 3 C-terminal domain-containing protein, partial [Sinobacteraceae bacterium]|nr:glycoside hydrolase family 3 C-terminal domain-containing protein [Nevskiaceae bacterium]